MPCHDRLMQGLRFLGRWVYCSPSSSGLKHPFTVYALSLQHNSALAPLLSRLSALKLTVPYFAWESELQH